MTKILFNIKLKIGYKSTFSRSRARLVTLSEVLGSFYITGNRSLNFLKTQLPNCCKYFPRTPGWCHQSRLWCHQSRLWCHQSRLWSHQSQLWCPWAHEVPKFQGCTNLFSQNVGFSNIPDFKKKLKNVFFCENPKFQGCTNPFFPEFGF